MAPDIRFPESLPVSARREDIMEAMRAHQVVIVCGETGSGKTTQLPKMALALGRGAMNARPGERPRLIGHTQPRRIAASSVAKRIAQELNTPLGEVVGYKVRFSDTLQKGASVKLMTDGILLAETQGDPLLQAYDTLIIDEAHERSLNIDFLLGYLRQILPRRPDLKVVVTSATIDAERFARHFADARGVPAPVIMVSGRTWPVELRWRPWEEKKDYDLSDAIADAVDELWAGGGQGGDILVFLPGEREIREAADHLKKHLQHLPALRSAEVLPLFSRLSQAEQDRIFEHHGGRRIVLATNVAETSLTVPGIKYVIDAGTARVKRYSFRSKVEQLLVEPISQAAANQRAGRCGRVANGICIRLYDEADFNQRERFTDPEILRSSLAGVILRMKSLGLGDVVNFPFLEAPSGRAIADGYQLLQELGAVDEQGALQPMGRELARLPLDPRVGRMIVEARGRGALAEVLVIAAALSVQDVRDRPLEAQAQADQAHAKFDDDKSEFSGYVRLWNWLHDARGGKVVAQSRREMAAAGQVAAANARSQAFLPVGKRGRPPSRPSPGGGRSADQSSGSSPPPPLGEGRGGGQRPPDKQSSPGGAQTISPPGDTHKLSNRQWEQLLRQNYLNVRRVREWRDIHSQLLTVVREQRWPLNTQAAGYESVHLSMLAGLLGNIGFKAEDADAWLGAHGIKFHPHPGAHLSKRPGRWIVAAEQVQTSRLYGRGIAAIEPQWLEEVGAHLLKKQLLEPHWSKKQEDVIALERATLYGLVVYSHRAVSYGRVDPREARQLFIRRALVEGEWESDWPFLAANRKAVHKVQELEHKSRRQDVLVDDELIYAFYDQAIPEGVYSGATFDKWFRQAVKAAPQLLRITREELMRHEAAGVTSERFPRLVRLGGVDCAASYLHAPGDARDGVTLTLPLFALNQASEDDAQWLVPGMLKDKIQALLKSLPQRPRSRFVPLAENARRLAELLLARGGREQGGLLDVLLKQAREETGLDIKMADFKLDMLSPHLFMNFRVVDEHGRQLGQGRQLATLKAQWGGQARGAFQALASLKIAGSAQPEPVSYIKPSENLARQAPAAPEKEIAPVQPADALYTAWTFGELPELLEIRRAGQSLVGFPALIDRGEGVGIEVFDEPEVAAARHRVGLRRLVALQIRDALKYLAKNIPDLQRMAVAYMPLGTQDELQRQIIDVALERAFLQPPLPANAQDFARRIQEGRARLTLIANEVARLCAAVLQEYALAQRKIKETRNAPLATQDTGRQLQILMGKNFLLETPWTQLQHYPRYLKAIVLRLDKLRADPARDEARTRELQPLEQRYWRLLAERKGQEDARMQEYRWMLQELRVGFFAQELRTPYPASSKRLDKIWAQLQF
ncbi:ATP-dependent RNA helicase HrpA [Comamonas flocculans]|uniref:ATP-dependent RNA helicase HrpA n=1 Tax=Comamonas flocculans TaxID=2597701 RepID=A0A5B8RXW3_9BURK|nr:ATP-dependent RNA helicase HrpA [Comamonas flocculans]QEA14370.1 ATP-dependent RNA helicase HrpA [Comamonas flocculans]